jgi:hypothetical protein
MQRSSVREREATSRCVRRRTAATVAAVSEPRVTGDGCHEAVVEDPEGNRIEIVG